MKRLFIYLLIVLLFGAVFSIALSTSKGFEPESSTFGQALTTLMIPSTCYADSGSVGIPVPPPPIPLDP